MALSTDASGCSRWTAAALAALLGLSACGSDTATRATPAPPTEPTEQTAPVATAAAAGPEASPVSSATAAGPEASPVLPVSLTDDTGTAVTISSVERIIPVDGDLAEIVFALGLGDRVVATDLSATYPPAADALPQIGYQRALSAEPIAAFSPTVVLATDLAKPDEVIGQLRSLHVPVVVIDRQSSLDAPAAKVRAVAAALGVPGRGDALIATMQAQIDAAVAEAATFVDHPRVAVLYLRGDNTQLIFGKGSGVDVLLPAIGAVDVAAELGIGEFEQITAEALLRAAPDVIICSTTGLASVGGLDGLLAIPGIAETPAGRDRRVRAFEDQYLFGAGPRYGQLLSELVDEVHARP